MLKVLIINSTLERGGVTNVILNLCKGLKALGVYPIVLTLSPEPKNSAIDEFLDIGIEVKSLNLVGFNRYFRTGKKLNDFVKRLDFKVVQTFSFRGTWLTFKYLKNCLHVATLEADVYANYRDSYGFVIGTLIAKLELVGWGNSNHPIICSAGLKNLVGKRSFSIVHNGCDSNLYYPATIEEKFNIRRLLQLPEDKIIIVSTSSLIERKSPLTILEALPQLDDRFHFVMVGNGILEKELAPIINKMTSQVTWVKSVPNVSDYLRASDVFVSASKSEGYPNAVVEALLCGLKSIISDIPPHREIMELAPKQVRIFELGNANSLWKELTSADLLREVNTHHKIESELNQFSHFEMARKYLNIYNLLQ